MVKVLSLFERIDKHDRAVQEAARNHRVDLLSELQDEKLDIENEMAMEKIRMETRLA